jgi:hypothetical protein
MKRLALLAGLLVVGFVIWLNYSWILWHLRLWEKRVENLAVAAWGDAWDRRSQELGGPRAINSGMRETHFLLERFLQAHCGLQQHVNRIRG